MTLWGGRFSGEPDAVMRQLNDSFRFDQRLYRADIQGSAAYAAALQKAGVIEPDEKDQLVDGLQLVQAEFDDGAFQERPGDEDIHTAVERRLEEVVGPVAGKLHTGRSRNDQVATDIRLYLLDEIATLGTQLKELEAVIVDKAEEEIDVIMPGYTHMQHAQPILFSHWLLSHFWKIERDLERLSAVATGASVLPLGAGAIAGNPFGIDREWLSGELGFSGVSENSVDAVNDRDYIVEFLAWAALVQVHLSQLAEDLILWSSHEFGFVELDDAYSTGSSLMPQKKNPDVLELMRGKSGRMTGHLVGLLMALKGLPSTYNKDLQEDKEALFDAIDTLELELPVATGVISTLRLHKERIFAALDDGMLATDIADYLVGKGVPFRRSHHLVGEVVKRAEERNCSLRELPFSEYQHIDPIFSKDVYEVFDFARSVAARSGRGGTAPSAVHVQIEKAKTSLLESFRS
ncbi:MAG: argininosuccinate lyase [Candidatus Bipolaricaulota bacterium]|nr:argininosuccinate lyase [Candidatus Bipolaricaulota bacterium]